MPKEILLAFSAVVRAVHRPGPGRLHAVALGDAGAGPAAGEDARPQQGMQADATPEAAQGSVTIAGEDAAEDVQRWTPPRVDRQGRSLAQLRRAAERRSPKGACTRTPTRRFRCGWRCRKKTRMTTRPATACSAPASAFSSRPMPCWSGRCSSEALAEASRQALVLLTLAPKDEKVRALQGRVELAQRVVAYNRAGEEDLRSGRIGEDGDGAIGNFREALALDEHNSRARQTWRRPEWPDPPCRGRGAGA